MLKRKILVSACFLLLLTLSHKVDIFANGGTNAADAASKVEKNINVNATTESGNGNYFKISVNVNEKVVTNARGAKGPNQAPCYLWYKYGDAGLLSTVLTSQDREKWGEQEATNIYNQMNTDDPQLKKDIFKYLRADKDASDYSLTLSDGSLKRYNVSSITGSSFAEKHISKSSSSASMDDVKALWDMNAYAVVPNPNALNDFDNGGRCGAYPGDTMSMIVVDKPVAGKIEPKDVQNFVKSTESNMKVQLTQVSDNQFQANLNFGNDQTNSPYKINSITYIWSLRVPSTDNPLSITQSLEQKGMSYKEPTSVEQNNLNFNYRSAGVVPGIDLVSILKDAFGESEGSYFNGNTYHKSLSDKFFEEKTVTDTLTKVMGKETDVLRNLGSNNYVSEFNIVKVDTISGNGTAFQAFNDKGLNTATFDIPSNDKGKYVVGVSVIVDGEYKLPTSEDPKDDFTFNYVTGYASDATTVFSSECAQLESDFGQLTNREIPEGQPDATKLEDQMCQKVEWVDPIAKATLSTTNNGKVVLDANGSTGTKKIEKRFKYTANTKQIPKPTVGCPDCTVTVYDGTAKEVTVNEQVIVYPIIQYTWADRDRVYNPSRLMYEIDLNPVSSGDVRRTDGVLNNSNTFACVHILTSAKEHNKDLQSTPADENGGQITNVDKDKYVEKVKNKNYLNCDGIFSNTEQRTVIENWK
jgi:hypothetical protein